ncbi:MAG: hypothetical protein ACRCYX_12130 [Dermatophilaceae bacterium]
MTDGAELTLVAWAGLAWPVFVIGLAQRFLPDRPLPLLGRLGRHSIVLYCTHPVIMTAVTTVLAGRGIDDARALTAANLVAALALGMLMIRYRSRQPVGLLFETPWSAAQILGRFRRSRAVSHSS